MKGSLWLRRAKLLRIILITISGEISHHPFKVIMTQGTDPRGYPSNLYWGSEFAGCLCLLPVHLWSTVSSTAALPLFRKSPLKTLSETPLHLKVILRLFFLLFESIPTDCWGATFQRYSFPVPQSQWIRVKASSLSHKMTWKSTSSGIFMGQM